MIIHRTDRWLIITPPKTGSTSLNRMLGQPVFGAEILHVDGQDHHQIEPPDYASDFARYILVRNPFARASSLFRWGLAHHRAYVDTGPIESFARFVCEALIGRLWPAFFYRTMTDYSPNAEPIRLESLPFAPRENPDPTGEPWQAAYRREPEACPLVRAWAAADFDRFGYEDSACLP